MNEVKRKIHYFCKDTVQKGYAGQKITAAVLDTGESVIILSGDAKELMENGVGLLSIQKNVEKKICHRGYSLRMNCFFYRNNSFSLRLLQAF